MAWDPRTNEAVGYTVDTFVRRHSDGPVDEVVAEYVKGLLIDEDGKDEEASYVQSHSELVDVICSFLCVDPTPEISEEVAGVLVELDGLQKAHATGDPAASAPPAPLLAAVTVSQKDAQKVSQNNNGQMVSRKDGGQKVSQKETHNVSRNDVQKENSGGDQRVASLRELFPRASEKAVRCFLGRSSSIEDAVEDMLAADEDGSLYSDKYRDRDRSDSGSSLTKVSGQGIDPHMKNAIIQQFGIQSCSIRGASPTKRTPTNLERKTLDGGGKTKVRYRDGVVATQKGEKYIVEKSAKDEEAEKQASCSIRIITKGKRGKGFK